MKLTLKLVLIGALLLVLAVPVMMLQGLVWERQQRGREVAAEIAQSSSGSQQLLGPLLRIEFERSVRRVRLVGKGDTTRSETEIVRERHAWLRTPTRLEVDGTLDTELRRRGLFEARLWHGDLALEADFEAVVLPPMDEDVVAQRIVDVALVYGLSDARGIRAVQARVDGKPLSAEPGTGVAWWGAGFQLGLDPQRALQPLTLHLGLQLSGTEALHFVPVGDDTRIALDGDWRHPSFSGQFLPVQRTVAGTAAGEGAAALAEGRGFSAEWRVSKLAAQAPQLIRQCGVDSAACAAANEAGFGLRLLDPVDRYLKTERAIKYAWLFIVLVFGALFFVELLRAVRVHPLQYGLTGLALALFFLLLLSLSEHIGFAPAYVLAATACVALVSTYMAVPLGSRARAGWFGALLAGLYGLLYGLLQSEDYALLMGALALFGLLAAAMLLTRRFDWYRPAPLAD